MAPPKFILPKASGGLLTHGLAATWNKDGVEFDGDPVVVIEAVDAGATPKWMWFNGTDTASGCVLDEITAGANPPDAGWIEVECDGEMLEAPADHDITSTYIELDGTPPDTGPTYVDASATMSFSFSAEAAPISIINASATLQATFSAVALATLEIESAAFIPNSRVEETASCIGPYSAYTLLGAISEHVSFSAGIGTQKTCEYYAEAPGKWEYGTGIYYAGQIHRLAFKSSSTGSAIDWTGSETIRIRNALGPGALKAVRHLVAADFPYTATDQDRTFVIDPGNSDVTLTLPDLMGKPYRVRISDDFSGTGSVDVDDAGGTLLTLDTAGQWSDFEHDLAGWNVYQPGGAVEDGSLTVDNFHVDAIVTEADTIASSDNDTTIPTSAAVKDYADSAIAANAPNVTLDGTPNYITIVGQVITRALINLASHVTGILPIANGGTGGTWGVRERLSANRTYYVRTDGSDSNDGLTNSSGGAFLTIQKAVDVVAALDMSIYDVLIQVGNGTYTTPVTLKHCEGAGKVTIRGDTTTPANVVISTTSAACFTMQNVGNLWKVEGVKCQTTTSGQCFIVMGNSYLEIGTVNVGACGTHHFQSALGGTIVFAGSAYTVSGGALGHWVCTTGGTIACNGFTITLSGTPAFSLAWAYATSHGFIQCIVNTFSGSATGKRYDSQTLALIDTGGGGATYLPGNSGGTAVTGQYA